MSFASAEAAYHDDGGDPHEGYVTEERAEELFTAGLQAMREVLARFVEQAVTRTGRLSRSQCARTGTRRGVQTPGRPDEIATDCWSV